MPVSASWSGVGIVDTPNACPWQCVGGFFNEYSLGVCRPHSNVECNSTQFKISGNHLYDAMCVECSTCEEMWMASPCNDTSDSVCESCSETLKIGETFRGVESNAVCDSEYVRNLDTQECELCDRQCPIGDFKGSLAKHDSTLQERAALLVRASETILDVRGSISRRYSTC